jgi:hypothetical protein
MARLGLGYDDIAAVHPKGIYVSVSGFGNTVATPYRDWPAYASIVEAMSGIYEMKRTGDSPPAVAPAGALATSGPRCSPPSGSWPRCGSGRPRARDSTSTLPCSTRWSP